MRTSTSRSHRQATFPSASKVVPSLAHHLDHPINSIHLQVLITFIFRLDQLEDGSTIQDALEDKTGQRTVPNIFIGKKHIGGDSDLSAVPSGALKKMLTDANGLAAQ